MAFLNSRTSATDLVLDASKFSVHRLHFVARIYQCSWYWRGWADDIKDPSVLNQFSYLITNDPVTLSSSYCSQPVQRAVELGRYKSVYQDGTYVIYEKTQ